MKTQQQKLNNELREKRRTKINWAWTDCGTISKGSRDMQLGVPEKKKKKGRSKKGKNN